MRSMFDAVTPGNIQPNAPMVAGYIDGRYAWTAQDWAKWPSPLVRKVRIACFASTVGADVYDVENWDVTPQQVPAILRRERAAGRNPTIYCDRSNLPIVRALVSQAGLLPQPPYWVSTLDGNQALYPGSVATQWIDHGATDESVVDTYWPGVDPGPHPGGTVLPEFYPPVPAICVLLTPSGKGAWLLAPDGAVYTHGDAGYHGGCNGQPYFNNGRVAAQIVAGPPGKTYTIIDTAGERYDF